MPREVIGINVTTLPTYEAGAALLAGIAYPAAGDERATFHAALCRETLLQCARQDDGFAWSPRAVSLGYFAQLSDIESQRAIADGFSRLRHRMVAGWVLLRFLTEADGVGPGRIQGHLNPSLNTMALLANAQLGSKDEGTAGFKTRTWKASRPVAHIAAGMHWAIHLAERLDSESGLRVGERERTALFLHEPDVLRAAIQKAEEFRLMLPKIRQFQIDEAETIQFVLG